MFIFCYHNIFIAIGYMRLIMASQQPGHITAHGRLQRVPQHQHRQEQLILLRHQ